MVFCRRCDVVAGLACRCGVPNAKFVCAIAVIFDPPGVQVAANTKKRIPANEATKRKGTKQ